MNTPIPAPEDRGYAHPEYLITTDWVEEHLDDPGVVLVDQDPPDAHGRVRIPGAVNYADHYYKETPGGVHIQDPRTFAETMSAMGIGDDTLVVGYDSDACHWAARLLWCLKYNGHDNVRALDGGFPKWFAEGRPLARGGAAPRPAQFTPRTAPEVFAGRDDVLACSTDPDAILLDVRSDEEWTGVSARGTARGGRLRNAVHLEWKNFVTGGDVPVIKPADELRKMLDERGITPDKNVVTY